MEVKFKTVQRERVVVDGVVVDEVEVPERFQWRQEGGPNSSWFARWFCIKADDDYTTTTVFTNDFDFILSPESTVNMFDALWQIIESSETLKTLHADKFGTVDWQR